jgi:4-amino-4-deoxy-L-arabinose transferase-like glycosyltransferase
MGSQTSGMPSSTIIRDKYNRLSIRLLHIFLVCIVLGFGLWLQTMNIHWGLPDTHSYLNRKMDPLHPDELVLVQEADDLRQNGIFKVKTLRYPPLHAQLTAALETLSGVLSLPKRFLLARGISIAASFGSLLLLYFLGMRWNRRTALMACAFLSVSMVAVREAHWANPEPLSAFWILFACVLLFYIREDSGPWPFVLMGAAIALGIASKYFAVLFIHLPVLAAVLVVPDAVTRLSGWKRVWRSLRCIARRVLLSYATFGVVIFFTLAVYVLGSPAAFLQAYRDHAPWAAKNGLYGIFPTPVSIPTYIAGVLPIALGMPLYLSSMAGIILSVFMRKRANLVLIACILPLWIFLECIHYHPLRFCLSLIPVLCLLAANFFDVAMSHRLRLVSAIAKVGVFAVVLYSGIISYSFISATSPRNDTRLLATQWLEAQHATMEQVAMLGVDLKNNSIGLIQFLGVDRTGGNAYPILSNAPEYIVVLENIGHIMRQNWKLTQAGYHYSKNDWYPMTGPSTETIKLYQDLASEKGYRRAKGFSTAPTLRKLGFNYEALKYDLAITNMDISIYQRMP